MDWIYRFTENEDYPDPREEISFLSGLVEDDKEAFLLLNNHKTPPMSGSTKGQKVGLCTSETGRLILHGTATVADKPKRQNTPSNVLPIYGMLTNRMFCQLETIEIYEESPLDPEILSYDSQESFLQGQATVKKVLEHPSKKNEPHHSITPSSSSDESLELRFSVPKEINDVVTGVDPTAASWASKMTIGKKKMPSFSIRISNGTFTLPENPLFHHHKNDDLWDHVKSVKSSLVCIDGPCDTNGPRLLSNISKGWDKNACSGIRECERRLFREGVGLFWTTQNTVMKFEGASRWIARSIILFSEYPKIKKIETHPHGVFTFLWHLLGNKGTPPKKTKPEGRMARIDLLQKFIPDLNCDLLKDHDSVDAAAAALVAALHRCGLTKPFGSEGDGGQIWMPDCNRIKVKSKSRNSINV
ncbi:DUF429 domain-containing protein [Gimesia benthica]|uniref:DUF429 domain-containing protein n=1 Tax=Gimesia benthica TaxID=2608982 RepID=A0A6I6AGH8_9PLAN|nr:DUF429 domain-containing protein [Gimesia benthica]QGQ23939.1 DUF429 domain-containing protein [Gimesia benthica]